MTIRTWPARALAACGFVFLAVVVAAAQTQSEASNGATPRGAPAHKDATPALAATRATTITVDGRLDEADWNRAQPAANFRQSSPNDGDPATQRTEIRILFDDDALYIGARMYDSLGANGVRTRLIRRDQWTDSDWIEFIFDTYHDHIGRTSFAVNPSGVKRDAGVASSSMDSSWDPVWTVGTAIDSLGWTAEFRIPFSQLRFAQGKDQVWGLQVWRTVSRLNEIDMWSYWSQKESGGPQRFGHVEGLEITGKPQRLEVLPYVVGRTLFNTPPSGDPFHDGSEVRSRVGADMKYLVTSNMTLNATINPDFGQVEVDPAVVNLSAFETFFPERRPFFIEGGGVFGFGGFNCYFCSNVSSMSLFYTRRIGRRPAGGLPSDTEYDDVPDNSRILGAAKLTGRLPSGTSIGVLDAVTSRETASLIRSGAPADQVVEPLTNYFVGRVKQDFRRGDYTVGAIVTSVVRDLKDQPLLVDRMSSHAEAIGFDWRATWKSRTYSFIGNFASTNVVGDSSAILRLQRSSARYFQRPDRESGGNGLFSDLLDSSSTRLRGYGGYARLAKDSGNWLWETQVNYRSPGFEPNDLAFNTRSDYVWMGGNVVRNYPTPGSWYRWLWISAGGQQQYNFDGDLTDRQLQLYFGTQFLNYWNLNAFTIYRPDVLDDRATRGGPVVKRPGSWYFSGNWSSDSRKPVSLNLNLNRSTTSAGGWSNSVSAYATLKPASNISVDLGPSWSKSRTTEQFVQSVTDPVRTAFHGRRYVFADTRQTSVSMDTRLNVTFTPTLTFELFAQPFISSVDYQRFKEFAAPRELQKIVYGVDAGTVAPVTNGQGQVTSYTIDPDGSGPSNSFSVSNPDFVFRSLRGNAVLRWEYRPGSTLFLVWTQSRSQSDSYSGDFSFRAPDGGVFGRQPDNVFLLKVNYWLSM